VESTLGDRSADDTVQRASPSDERVGQAANPGRWGTAPLRIRSIETIGLRVPLPRVFRGSKYHRGTRCTIITRVFTEDGIVGEAYNGDEDATQPEIRRIIHHELAPALVGHGAFHVEGRWEGMLPANFYELDRAYMARYQV
jgi:L-alanine-DL-glutamate epimerase-like enolase superfamily enzyme